MAKKVLVVDDSVSMRQMLSMILTSGGYEVVPAQDAKEGLTKLSDELSAIITDYNMPGMNGVDFIKEVRSGSIASTKPIIMVTTESEQTKKDEGKAAGATGWITKPFDKSQLLEVMEKITGDVEF
ncbi:MAG: response regulator [Alkalispirochaetaceae bacterium]